MFKNYENYADLVKAVKADERLTDEEKNALVSQAAEAQYGAETFDQAQFDTLLNKLTGSKMKQQRQKSVEGRRDIYAGGLAGMMRNF